MYFILSALLTIFLFAYTIYQRRYHPLSRYPGPFWPSVTDFWNVLEWISGQHPYRLTALHEKYGPVVRYGPNRLSFTAPDVVNTVFIKGFKSYPKTEFYDTFGNARMPHLFINKDPAAHALRRRLMLKSFSPQAVEKYEGIINSRLGRLRAKIRDWSNKGVAFDLKAAIYLFMCDLISALMYGQDFDIQRTGENERMPDDHALSRSNAILGAWPSMRFLALLQPIMPLPQAGIWKMRNTLSYIFEGMRFVHQRKQEVDEGVALDRGDVITSVLTSVSKVPEGVTWTETDSADELIGFVFAGIHPAAATMAMLFWHLLHNPDILEEAAHEVEENLPSMTADKDSYSFSDVESHLPYLRSCIKENFRTTPAFSMPLSRYVTDDETFLNGEKVPKGTCVAVCNHAFHHNPEVWGPDHNVYDPSRWESASGKELSKLLMHFGAGGRQCIGKALATSVIHKLVSTIIAEFSLELADSDEQRRAVNGGFRGVLPRMKSVSISDLKGPLMVRAGTKKVEKT